MYWDGGDDEWDDEGNDDWDVDGNEDGDGGDGD